MKKARTETMKKAKRLAPFDLIAEAMSAWCPHGRSRERVCEACAIEARVDSELNQKGICEPPDNPSAVGGGTKPEEEVVDSKMTMYAVRVLLVRGREGNSFVILGCPWCGDVYHHGAGGRFDDPRRLQGSRVPHRPSPPQSMIRVVS